MIGDQDGLTQRQAVSRRTWRVVSARFPGGWIPRHSAPASPGRHALAPARAGTMSHRTGNSRHDATSSRPGRRTEPAGLAAPWCSATLSTIYGTRSSPSGRTTSSRPRAMTRAPCTVHGPIPGIVVSSAMSASSGSSLRASWFRRPSVSRSARSRSVPIFRHDSPVPEHPAGEGHCGEDQVHVQAPPPGQVLGQRAAQQQARRAAGPGDRPVDGERPLEHRPARMPAPGATFLRVPPVIEPERQSLDDSSYLLRFCASSCAGVLPVMPKY